MKMEQFNHRKTPLGEQFDNADFPIEPNAWDDMERLLATENKPLTHPLSIGGNKMLLVIALVCLGLLWWYQSQSATTKMNLNRTNTLSQVNTFSATGEGVTTNSVISYNQVLKTGLPAEANTIPALLSVVLSQQESAVFYFENTFFSKENRQNSSLFTQKRVVLEETKSVFEGSRKEGETYSKLTKKENFTKINDPNSVSEIMKNASNAALLSEQVTQTPPQYFGQNTAFKAEESTKIVENSAENNVKNNVKNNELSGIIPLDSDIQKANNQESTFSNDLQNTPFFPLALLTPDAIYSTANYNPADYQTLKNLSESKLIPLSKLVRGARHQLDFGIGTATYNAPKNVNHFRLGYQYRLTPLFGLGASANYSVKKDEKDLAGFAFTGEVEGLLYFVNRRKIDFIVSAGYGYRQWKKLDNGDGKAKGFTLGLVFQYRIGSQWVTGLRIDIKEFGKAYQDPAAVLTLGKKF